MRERRVVVTGIGAITPLGHSLAETAAALDEGRSAIAPATLFDASEFACVDAAEVRDWDPRPSFRTPKALKLTDRSARFAVAAAQMALSSGSWPREEERLAELGVLIGSSGSDLQARELARAMQHEPDAAVDDIAAFARRMLDGLNPLWLLVNLPNMTSSHVAIQLAARGPNSTIMSDWIAGHQAIAEGADWIRAGEVTAVLAGGADGGVQPFAYCAFQQAGLFDQAGKSRFVPGEGAAMLLLEERDAAIARGAPIRAELVASSTHTAALPDLAATLARTYCHALGSTHWDTGEVTTYRIVAPAVPTFAEPIARAASRLFPSHRSQSTVDQRLGHAMAAAGPIDAALMLAAARPGDRCVSTAVAFSGHAATVAFEIPAA